MTPTYKPLAALEARFWPLTPVFNAERTRTLRAAEAAQAGRRPWRTMLSRGVQIAWWLYLASLFVAVVVLAVRRGDAGSDWWRTMEETDTNLLIWATFGATFSVLMLMWDHFVYGLLALRIASASIAREKTGKSFDLLRITLQTPVDIVLGKWRAAVVAYVVPSRVAFIRRSVLAGFLAFVTVLQYGEWDTALFLAFIMLWLGPALRAIAGAYLAAAGVLCSALMPDETAASRLTAAVLVMLQIILLIGAFFLVFLNTFATSFNGGSATIGGASPFDLGLAVLIPIEGGLTSLQLIVGAYTFGQSLVTAFTAIAGGVLVFGPLVVLMLWAAVWRVRRG